MSDPGQGAAPPPFTWEAPPAGTPGAAAAPAGGQMMTSGDIFERSVSTYRRGFLVLLAVAAVVQVPVAIIDAVIGQRFETAFAPFAQLSGRQPTSEELTTLFQNAFPSLISAGLTIGLVSLIAGLLLSPALIATIARIDRGEPASIGDAYTNALRSALPILGGSIIVGLVLTGLFLGILVVGIVIAAVSGDFGLGVLAVLVALVVATVAVAYVSVRWAVWAQAVVLERRGPLDALRRSWSLVRGSMWRVLGITLVAGIVAAIAGLVISVIGGILGSPLPGTWRTVVPAILGILTASWLPIVTTLIFFDLRTRHEVRSQTS